MKIIFYFLGLIMIGLSSCRSQEDYIKLGKIAQDSGKYEVAVKYYSEALYFDSACYSCYYLRGESKYSLKNYSGAISDFYKALTVEKKDIRKQLSCLNYISGFPLRRIDLGIKILDSLISVTPNIEYYNERAYLKMDINDYQGALDDFTFIYENTDNPEHELFLNIASCNYQTGNFMDAMQNYNKVIELMPKDYSKHPESIHLDGTYMHRGNCKLQLGDLEGALQDYYSAEQLCKNSNEYSDIYNCIGKVKIGLKDYHGAIAALNKGIELNKGNTFTSNAGHIEKDNSKQAEALYFRGFAKFYLNDRKGACKDWSISGELGSKNAYEQIQNKCN